jgi:HAD superfamily hydrolase (TIGR01509 family)
MRAVLWDMDGVLVHSADYHYAAWKAALAPESIDLTRVAFERTFGQRNDTVLRDLISPDIGASEIARIAALKEDLYRQFVRTHGIQPLDGVLHWLEKLTAQGWRHAVASAAPRGNVDCILEVTGMEHYFGAITSAEDVTRGKPDPQVYLLAAERVATPPTQCIVVEDAPAGLQGARSAGIKCIGVLTTHPHLDADIVVRSLSDLGDDAFAQLIH